MTWLRTHRKTSWTLAGVLLLLIIAAIAGNPTPKKVTPSAPSAAAARPKDHRWQRLISCLEAHPLFAVFDAYSTNAKSPGANTKAVVVWQTLKGTDLAYVGNKTLGADDNTGAAAATVNLVDGPIHYGFDPVANARNKLDIRTCVEGSYGQ
jgi:hypothetical protein